MIGYIKILKNQIANEMQVNRHIKAKREMNDEHYSINPNLVNKKIKGLKRNSWVILSILILINYGMSMHEFWVSKIIMLLISILLILNIYTNSHNIHNHQRWLSGVDLLDKKGYFSLFRKKAIYCILNSFIGHQGDRK